MARHRGSGLRNPFFVEHFRTLILLLATLSTSLDVETIELCPETSIRTPFGGCEGTEARKRKNQDLGRGRDKKKPKPFFQFFRRRALVLL